MEETSPATNKANDTECRHEWEDAQLRTTKDGMYVASFEYCPKCGLMTFPDGRSQRLNLRLSAMKAKD